MSDRCPIHGIPDCSPLLNGCSLPNRLAAAKAEGRREVREAVEAAMVPFGQTDGNWAPVNAIRAALDAAAPKEEQD